MLRTYEFPFLKPIALLLRNIFPIIYTTLVFLVAVTIFTMFFLFATNFMHIYDHVDSISAN